MKNCEYMKLTCEGSRILLRYSENELGERVESGMSFKKKIK